MRSSHVNDTHRQCRTCKAWKVHAEYDYQAATCKECRRARHRARFRILTEDERQRHHVAQLGRARRLRAKRSAEQRADARFAVRAMQARGWTMQEIRERSGVYPDTVRKIIRGEGKYIQPGTVKRLYAALRATDA